MLLLKVLEYDLFVNSEYYTAMPLTSPLETLRGLSVVMNEPEVGYYAAMLSTIQPSNRFIPINRYSIAYIVLKQLIADLIAYVLIVRVFYFIYIIDCNTRVL